MKRGNQHTGPADTRARFDARVEVGPECWEWRGVVAKSGYGVMSVKLDDGSWAQRYAHRLSYEFHVGPIPEGATLDHLCMNTLCVRPEHLDPCSTQVNTRRSPRTLTGANIRKTHCPKGHPYSGANLYYDQGKRKCRECVRARNRAASRRRTQSRR